MEKLFSIAEKIATPLSLAALALLILYAIYKLIFSKLPLQNVLAPDVYSLASRAMTLVFMIGLAALILGIVSYVLVLYINAARAEKADLLLRDLGSDSRIVRLASVNGLLGLAGISKAADIAICDGVSSFVRQHTNSKRQRVTGHLESDLEAAVRALSTLIAGDHCTSVDLSGSDLRGLDLTRGRLPGTILSQALLDEANLADADLTEAHLIGSSLIEATLRNAKLKRAILNDARFERTDLRGADLRGATGLAGADLRTAVMGHSILTGVDLRSAKLPIETTMTGVSLAGADLRQTDLRFVKGICKQDVDAAVTDDTTKLPPKYSC
jgi:uncharacterized protein YjbI with pentapeptide repeats